MRQRAHSAISLQGPSNGLLLPQDKTHFALKERLPIFCHSVAEPTHYAPTPNSGRSWKGQTPQPHPESCCF